MNDQASSLRKLKMMVDQSQPKENNTEEFLQGILRPTPFLTIALIWPDNQSNNLPDPTQWIAKLMGSSPRACLWDQAKIIPSNKMPMTHINLKYLTPVRLEAGLSPLNVFPHQVEYPSILKKEIPERIDFLKHIIRSLKTFSEVWITVRASQLKESHPLIHASDSVCIAVPHISESILNSYEIVKAVHLSGYFSPIGLLDIKLQDTVGFDSTSNRIKFVAKQFLALDLVDAGVVLFDNTFDLPLTNDSLRQRLSTLDVDSRDFLFCLSESMLYVIPGLF